MAMEITNTYSSYVAQSMAGNSVTGGSAVNSTKKKETEKTTEAAESSKSKSAEEYMNELKKLAPSVEFKVGNSYSPAKSGKTLTVSPQLLEKMQNDPEKEKEMKELIKGVESMTKLLDGIYKASGWTVEYRHSYIDENGKYCAVALVRNDYMLNLSDELREERRQNAKELIEQTKEKVAGKEEELQEILEEEMIKKEEELEETLEKTLEEEEAAKEEEELENTLKEEEVAKEEEELGEIQEEEEAEKIEEKSAYSKVERLLNEKLAASKDGLIYLDDTDFMTMLEAAEEDNMGRTDVKEQMQVGANFDLRI